MALPDCFDPAETGRLVARIQALTAASTPRWGQMDAAQMLAHCCAPYLQLKGELGGGPALMRFIARTFFKQAVVGEAPFKQSVPTPRAFVVADGRDLAQEQARLVDLLRAAHGQGAAAFEGRPHLTFGPLTAREWSNLLWKHLDHHLRQFGA